MFELCKHEYVEIGRSEYIDYSGYRVLRIEYKCKKCGRKKAKKYY